MGKFVVHQSVGGNNEDTQWRQQKGVHCAKVSSPSDSIGCHKPVPLVRIIPARQDASDGPRKQSMSTLLLPTSPWYPFHTVACHLLPTSILGSKCCLWRHWEAEGKRGQRGEVGEDSEEDSEDNGEDRRATRKPRGDKELSKLTHVDLHSPVNKLILHKWNTSKTSRVDQPEVVGTFFWQFPHTGS